MDKIRIHPMSVGPGPFGDNDMFSAFYPLGCLTAFAKAHRDGALRETFDFGKVTPTPANRVADALGELPDEPGIFLFSSYVWNHSINMSTARLVKERWPSSLVVVGGPHIPRMPARCAEFFAQHPYVDVAVRHEGEATLADLLDTVESQGLDPGALSRVDLSRVSGVTSRRDGELIRTADRARPMDLGAHPSPYLAGEYDHWLFDRRYIPLETNRGCPYGCTFCDWGAATLSKITRFTMERIFGEIELAAKRRIHTIGFCDANFGVLPRDLEITRFIVETASKYGYPRDVGFTNAKTAKGTLLEIAKVLRDAGLNSAAQISMQTIDETVLKNVERANIKTTEYRKMIAFLHRENIPAASDMMVGLPGQTFETCKTDLQFFFDHKVIATIFATSVMPNAPMADPAYQERFRIVVDDEGMVESTYSFTREEYQRMFSLCLAYKLFVKLGLLKYVLYYAQVEHGLPAMDFVARWLEKCDSEPDRYPLSSRIKREMIGGGYRGGKKDWLILGWKDDQAAFLFDDPSAFHREILSFLEAEHGVSLTGPVAEAVLAANGEVMPRKGRQLPAEVPLTHDVPGYFSDLRVIPSLSDIPPDHVPLGARPPGALKLKDAPSCTSYGFIDFGLTRGELELASNLQI